MTGTPEGGCEGSSRLVTRPSASVKFQLRPAWFQAAVLRQRAGMPGAHQLALGLGGEHL